MSQDNHVYRPPPPHPTWQQLRKPWVAVATVAIAGLSAVVDGALGPITGAVTGTVETHASVAGSLGQITGTCAATVESHASVAGSLGNVTGTVTAAVESHASVAGTIGNVTGTITARSYALRLRAHHSGRYLIDQRGRPFYVHGDTAWSIVGVLTRTEMAQYLDDCQARGFTAVIFSLIENAFSNDPPKNADGESPFTGTMFQSSLDSNYWADVDWLIDACAERGIVAFINPAYIGAPASNQGVANELVAATGTQVQNYGSSVGARYESRDNVVYHLFGDDGPAGTLLSRVQSLQAGLASGDHRHTLYGTHYYVDTQGHDGSETWMTWDYIYKYGGFVHQAVLAGYNDSRLLPVILGEALYDLENSSTALDIRRQAWGTFLTGGCGSFYGHRDIWGFGYGLYQTDTWQNALDDTGRVQQAHLLSFVQQRWWWEQAPDQSSTLVTAGRGSSSSANYVVAALGKGGAWAAAYIPAGSSNTITIDRTKLAGTITARWYNPRTGAYTTIGGSHPNTGTEQFTPSDGNDWVLALDAQSVAEVSAFIGEITGTVTALHGQSATVSGSLGAITGTVTAKVETHASVSSALGAITGTVTSTVLTHASVASALGAITGTVTAAVETHAAVDSALDAISGTVTATVETHADVAGSLGAITGAISAVHGDTILAEVSAALGPITGAVSATVETHASVASALGAISGTIDGVVETHGSVSGALSAIGGTVTAAVETHGAIAGALGPITGTVTAGSGILAAGNVTITGTSARVEIVTCESVELV